MRSSIDFRPANILMRTQCLGMTYWWLRELVVTDQGLEWEIWKYQHRVKMTLPYERMARAALLPGSAGFDLQISGTTSTDNLLVRGLNHLDGVKVLSIIERCLARERLIA
ncbi:MAG TPA: hypothetical protein VK457_08915 [Chloroflexota bacterium]|nr:hypothetical protein [Chloroflexota bacterium]